MSHRLAATNSKPKTRDHSPFKGEEQAKGEEKSNRNNPTFINRRNPMKIKNKTFSNRNKNSTSGLPHFRPPQTPTRSLLPDLLGAVQGRGKTDPLRVPQMSPSSWKRTGCPRVLLTFAFDSPTFWHAGPDKIPGDARKPKKIAKFTSRRGNRWR
jgi:hypothetical protein